MANNWENTNGFESVKNYIHKRNKNPDSINTKP